MGEDDENEATVLRRAIAKQEAVLRSMERVHGEFHLSVSDDLAQLALLYSMSGAFDKALPLLHKRLVIHEKFGPEELTGETLQALGTVYRLHGVLDVAQQHLERALATREQCHGRESLKVAETLNSLVLVHATRGDAAQADATQLRSLNVQFASPEPEDIESEDVPWEVFKRLKQQRGPSTASNSITLLKAAMRKSADAAVRAHVDSVGQNQNQMYAASRSKPAVSDSDSIPQSPIYHQIDTQCAIRSHSDTNASAAAAVALSPLVSSPLHHRNVSSPIVSAHRAPSIGVAFSDLQTLQQHIELLKRRIVAGLVSDDSDADVVQFAADVDATSNATLQNIGFTLLSLVHEMLCLRVSASASFQSHQQMQLPLLEGLLEKKSASIFRGWEKRYFHVDPATFLLSYHFSKDDWTRGFAPRGGFSLTRMTNIIVHRFPRGLFYHLDVVVDLSTRLNPLASRTYELRCTSEETLRYWVETLQYYKATMQRTPLRPATS